MYRVLFIDSIPRSYEHQTPIARSKMTAEHPVEVFDPYRPSTSTHIQEPQHRNTTKTQANNQKPTAHQIASGSINEKDDSAEMEREGGEFDRPTDRGSCSFIRESRPSIHPISHLLEPSKRLRRSHVTSASGAAVSIYTAREARKNRPWEQTNRPSTTGPYQSYQHMGARGKPYGRGGEEREKELISMWVLPYGKEARTERGKYR